MDVGEARVSGCAVRSSPLLSLLAEHTKERETYLPTCLPTLYPVVVVYDH